MSSERKEGYNTAEEDAKLKEYSWDEIRKHNTEEDLWVVIYNRVYNLTEFQIDHPGGPDVLQDIAAQDATEEFENILHTEKARKMAKKYLIGKVKGQTVGDLFQTNESSGNDGSGGATEIEPTTMNTWVTVGFLVVAAGLAYQFYLKDRL
mmetsp:Transcript_32059/g.28141  ORF Transcript_32059/g.28141 Transcript_32059/m.28141 type:complete len:150 (-) Transcript_32059:213-662(-)|eukprot:CAMPEP_0201575592 /NCGR_PEP_ID=MMETSP0190_2-20130828/20896_1 /ASSEMBLY_ACC=CAM_ASM_000263 /TAXON_ID=37353 /ORGANISM="Rosalina sp." /LENGTH=149 /DNA_ID=CAMNT_0048005425 /DNA_START=91 /DNA_END=540 /DNA_ORIENTATION=-